MSGNTMKGFVYIDKKLEGLKIIDRGETLKKRAPAYGGCLTQ